MTSKSAASILLALFVWVAPAFAKSDPELILQDGHSDGVTASVFSRDGHHLFSASEDGTIKQWDLDTGRVVFTYLSADADKEGAYRPRVNSVALMHDEKWVVSGASDGKVRVFSTADGGLVREWAVPASYGTYLRIAGLSGDRVAAVGAEQKLYIYNAANGQLVKEQALDITGRALAAHDKMIAVADRETLVMYGDDGRELARQKLSSDGESLTFSHDGSKLVVVGSKLDLMAAPSLKVLSSQDIEGSSTQAAFVGDKLWLSNQRSGHFGFGPLGAPVVKETGITSLASSLNGAIAAGGNEGEIYLVKAGSKEPVLLPGKTSWITALATDSQGRYLITGSRQGAVKLYDLGTGRIERRYPGHEAYVGEVAISPDGSLVAASDFYWGKLIVWDAKTAETISTYELDHYSPRFAEGIQKIVFSPDGQNLAIARTDKPQVELVDARRGRRRMALPIEGHAVGLAFSPDGERLAVGTTKDKLQEFLLSSRTVVSDRKMQDDAWSIAYSPDGKRMAAGGYRGVLKVWETEFEDEPVQLNYKGTAYFGLRFIDNNHLLSVGGDGKLRSWDLATRKPREVVAHGDSIGDLAVLAGGKVLVTRGGDSKIKLWNASDFKLLGTLVELDHGQDWVVTTPGGLFDGTTKGQRLLDWRIDNKLYNLEQFFNAYFTPGLLHRLAPPSGAAAKPLELTRSINDFKQPPRVRFVSPDPGAKTSERSVAVKVEVLDTGGGVTGVALYHNGHRLPDNRRQQLDPKTFEFRVELIEGQNDLEATAYNSDESVESRKDRVRITCSAANSRQPELHVVAIGVDKYQAGLSLSYAQSDAEAIAGFFKPGLFKNVRTHLLVNDQATRSGIDKMMTEIEAATEPQDALLVYVAGHGTVVGDMYYFLPYDAKVSSQEEIRDSGISSVALADRLSRIPATKQLVVLDTCRSGAAAGALGKYLARRSGLDDVRSQQMLARTAGTFLIAASTAEEYALELPDLKHGVLTYAILNALGESGKPTARTNAQGAVTVNALLEAVSSTVPNLTEKYHGQRQHVVQYSSGQDFPLVSAQ